MPRDQGDGVSTPTPMVTADQRLRRKISFPDKERCTRFEWKKARWLAVELRVFLWFFLNPGIWAARSKRVIICSMAFTSDEKRQLYLDLGTILHVYIKATTPIDLNNVIVNTLLTLNECVSYPMLSIQTVFKLMIKMVENWYWVRGKKQKWQKKVQQFLPLLASNHDRIAEYGHVF